MKKVMYGLLIVVMTLVMFSETVEAVNVAIIPPDQAQSVNTGNGANVGGAANTVSGTGNGAGGPGDGQGPGNGAGQGIGNGSGTSLVVPSDNFASPAPEPETLVLLGAGGLLVAYWVWQKSSRSSKHAS